jgi:hypothetical protein
VGEQKILRLDGGCRTVPYMEISSSSKGRVQPRLAVTTLCSEIVDEREQYALVVDVSEGGLRLERPLRGRTGGRVVQLEFTLPEVDEIIWAKGEICFDRLRRAGDPNAPLRSSGVRLVAAASRHLRLLRDYVRAAVESAARLELARG